jgi:threonyl-tRNA synthetase
MSVTITLPDGSRREFADPLSGAALAASIGPGLAKAAIALKVDGRSRDLATVIDRDAKVAIITRNQPDGLEILRHDAAHVMAEAVKELYPETQVTFVPATENGFYYDFARDKPFTPDDLIAIETKMREIVARDEKFVREVWPRDEAIAYFEKIGEKYKAELIRDLPES